MHNSTLLQQVLLEEDFLKKILEKIEYNNLAYFFQFSFTSKYLCNKYLVHQFYVSTFANLFM
uniref:Uncharacterized protein n=1 Tax=Solanum lycopersicum TaxID=4081 RepID=A0A3Q7HKH6_SOLLC